MAVLLSAGRLTDDGLPCVSVSLMVKTDAKLVQGKAAVPERLQTKASKRPCPNQLHHEELLRTVQCPSIYGQASVT